MPSTEVSSVVERFAAHPHVHHVRYDPASRSLVVNHAVADRFEALLASLPQTAVQTESADVTSAIAGVRSRPFWRELVAPAISLSAGLAGMAPLSTAVIGACALPIGRRALRSATRGRLNIDVLDATAVSLLLGSGDLLAAGVSVALIETGERIRTRASGGARRVLRAWMGADSRGVRIVEDGGEPRIAIARVKPGDLAVVYAGETVPVDGVVTSGSASVDNRTWTGEPYPKTVHAGERVLAGSTVTDGRLVVEVEATGDATRAGRLAIALEDAIAANTRVSDMARRIADRFVLPMFLFGGAVYLGTGDITRLISILIVDFGTGIRIAIPTSVLTTMVAGARNNVLFRNGNAIEELAQIDTVVFDKTGTLTTGNPSVVGITAVSGWEDMDALRLAASLEGHLPHPIARAIRRHARRRGLELVAPDEVSHSQGGGIVGRVEGHHLVVGDQRLLGLHDITTPSVDAGDSSVVLVAVDGRFVARIRLRDKLKPGVGTVISALRENGVEQIRLATGDRTSAARSVVRQLQLDGFDARMLPEDKVALVKRLRAQGRRVALVGDGINDAAAMAEANVGIAVSRGAELARETADIVLAGEDLMTLITALRLSRQAMGLVRQNIGIVAVPNAAALGVATVGGLSPLMATAANNGSTLLAGLNALRPLRQSTLRTTQ